MEIAAYSRVAVKQRKKKGKKTLLPADCSFPGKIPYFVRLVIWIDEQRPP